METEESLLLEWAPRAAPVVTSAAPARTGAAATARALSEFDTRNAAFEEAHRAQERRRYNKRLEESHRDGLLLIGALVMLLLWLLSRQTNNRPARAPTAAYQGAAGHAPRADRRSPVDATELARAVLEVVNNRDVKGYRALFLTGGEATRTMGREKAEAYLAIRSQKALQDALDQIAGVIPQGAIFAGAEPRGNGDFAMQLTMRDDANEEPRVVSVEIGRAVKVGAVLRLISTPRPRAAVRIQI